MRKTWSRPLAPAQLHRLAGRFQLITLTGSFRFNDSMNELLARVGTVSALRRIPILVDDGQKLGAAQQ